MFFSWANLRKPAARIIATMRNCLSQQRCGLRQQQRPFVAASRVAGRRQLRVLASEKAGQLLIEANRKYATGDKLSALKVYEDVMEEDPSVRQRQASLYGQTAVHASFGDVELAQMTLRVAIQEGLDFEQALQDPDLVEIVASQQVIIQLKRFNQQVQKAQQVAAVRQQAYAQQRGGAGSSRATDMQLQDILGKPNSADLDIDASPLGIAKRVALLLVVMVLLGTGLFFLGLETLFPKYG